MPHDELTAQLQRLLTGLADQEILGGSRFLYDGAALYPDEVADLLLPSVLCLAQALAQRLGMGDWGYRFTLGTPEAVGFPLLVTHQGAPALFLEVAPFLTQVFCEELVTYRDDVVRIVEAAARVAHADVSLAASSATSQ